MIAKKIFVRGGNSDCGVSSERRIDPRVSVTVPVYLVSSNREDPAEQAVTENVSAGGACVICYQQLELGERYALSPLSLNMQLTGRVVYCRPLASKRFCVGLAFERCFAHWWRSQPALASVPNRPKITTQN
ncbi:MAG: PilZ domain-containing protein [Candidatus Acidiferrales bacterium]